jgi:PAS domain S-box-containing protein
MKQLRRFAQPSAPPALPGNGARLGPIIRYGLLLAVALSLLPTAAALIFLSYQAQLAQVAMLQQERSRAAAAEIDAYMDDVQRRLGYLGRVRGLTDQPPEEQARLLEALARHNSAYEALAIARPDGTLSARDPRGAMPWAAVGELPEFRRALRTGEDVVGAVELDAATGREVLLLAVPVRDEADAVAGVLLARVNLEFLSFVVSRTNVGATGYTYVLDQRNRLIAERGRTPAALNLAEVRNPAILALTSTTPANPARPYQGLRGADVFGASAGVPSIGWRVVVELPTAEAWAPLRQMLVLILVALLAALLIAGGAGILFARRVVNPLRDLTNAAARMSTGDLHTAVPVNRSDELGVLALAFNDMTIRLRYLFDALGESEGRFRAIFDQSFQQMGLIDPQGNILEVNRAALEFSGLSPMEAVSRPFWELFWNDAPALQAQIKQALTIAVRGELARLELEGRGANGATAIFDLSLKPVRDPLGRVDMLIFEGRDITARRQVEALHADLRFSRGIGTATPDLIYVFDLVAMRNIYVNRSIESMLGYSAAEVQALGTRLLSTLMHPDDFAEQRERLGEVLRLADGAVAERVYRLKAANGEWRWVWGRDVIFERDAAGKPLKTLGVVQDITARKQADETMRLLAEISRLLTTSLDYDATVQNVARAAVPTLADLCTIHIVVGEGVIRQLAVAHRDPAMARHVWELEQRYPIRFDDADGLPAVLRSRRPELTPAIAADRLRMFAQDDAHLPLLCELQLTSSLCLPLIAQGRVLGAMSFYTTTSGRRYSAGDLLLAEEIAARAAQAIDNARLYRDAQEAIQARDQFLSIASHELKTPLTSLIGYTELLRRRAARIELPPRDQRAVQVIADQAARLNRMVATLLDLSRIQLGQLSIDPRPLDLCAVVRTAVQEAEPMLTQHMLHLHCPDAPLFVNGDELRLYQVLHNLIGNAIKYSPHGGSIAVSVVAEATTVRVAIRDQGIGIPAEALPHLFHRFYRAPNGEQEQISGMGLGLFVVKQLVTLHGGSVEVTSQEGQGSTFTVVLPLLALDSAAEYAMLVRVPAARTHTALVEATERQVDDGSSQPAAPTAPGDRR